MLVQLSQHSYKRKKRNSLHFFGFIVGTRKAWEQQTNEEEDEKNFFDSWKTKFVSRKLEPCKASQKCLKLLRTLFLSLLVLSKRCRCFHNCNGQAKKSKASHVYVRPNRSWEMGQMLLYIDSTNDSLWTKKGAFSFSLLASTVKERNGLMCARKRFINSPDQPWLIAQEKD